MKFILIVAGENSGEKYGADLIQAYQEIDPQTSFFGLGGPEMAARGADILYSINELNIVGLGEAVRRYPRIRRMIISLKEEAKKRKARAAVLIDSPDFNLRLARYLHREGIPILYYISPTVWAWRPGRLKTIRRFINKMLLIFPFEIEIYEKAGLPATYVGHPLLSRLKVNLDRAQFRQKYNLPLDIPLITLLPGSRPSEVTRHSPILSKSIDLIRNEITVNFLIIQAKTIERSQIEKFFDRHDNLLIINEDMDKYEAMAASDLLLAACGTANMEACLLEVPFIAFYRISPIIYLFGRKLVRIKNYSIVNIIAGKRFVPELIQQQFTPKKLAQEALSLLFAQDKREAMKQEFRRIKELLGEQKASVQAALELKQLIENYP
ncbi:MAG: lipid-A-disaccharide synthase [Candidatus Aminicenantes bacterium]|nr:lipid-A-disaccharide synthase [Candidatus Aminicenantes bacterium]